MGHHTLVAIPHRNLTSIKCDSAFGSSLVSLILGRRNPNIPLVGTQGHCEGVQLGLGFHSNTTIMSFIRDGVFTPYDSETLSLMESLRKYRKKKPADRGDTDTQPAPLAMKFDPNALDLATILAISHDRLDGIKRDAYFGRCIALTIVKRKDEMSPSYGLDFSYWMHDTQFGPVFDCRETLPLLISNGVLQYLSADEVTHLKKKLVAFRKEKTRHGLRASE